MKLESLLYMRCRHRSVKSRALRSNKGFHVFLFQLTKNADSYGIVLLIAIDGYNERVHRKKQHASSIHTIPSKMSPLFRFLFKIE